MADAAPMHMPAPVLDLERVAALRELVGPEEPDLVREIAGLFIESAEHDAECLAQALIDQDTPVIARLAHRLRGSASNVGAPALEKVCAGLEQLARAGGAVPSDPDRIRAEVVRAVSAVRDEFSV